MQNLSLITFYLSPIPNLYRIIPIQIEKDVFINYQCESRVEISLPILI